MSLWRILGYGFIFWVVGSLILVLQVQFLTSPAANNAVFFASSVLVPLIFAGLFFARGQFRPNWTDGLKVAAAWLVVMTLLDWILWIRFFDLAPATYFSWYLLVEYILLFLISVAVAEIACRSKIKQGPEGLI